MKQYLRLRLGLSLFIITSTTLLLLPNFAAVRESSLWNESVFSRFLPKRQVSQGLDLQGGIYLTLEVDVNKAAENYLFQAGQEIRAAARADAIQVTTPRRMGDKRLEFTLPDSAKEEALDALLRRSYPNGELDVAKQNVSEGTRFLIGFSSEYARKLEEGVLDMALATIRNRIDQFGVAEPDIRKQSNDNRIVVQLPGIDDTRRAIQIIGQTAHLEFHIEHELSGQTLSRAAQGILPVDALRLPMREGRGEGQIIVRREAVLTGEQIEDARQSYDRDNRPSVSITFNPRGSRQFERITGENVNKRMAIVLDGVAHSAPVIRDKITGGRAEITGNFTVAEANDLALVLRAGSLPAPVTVLEERTVGPSLGKASIDLGVKAAVIGVALVMVFMLAYYSLSGIIAVTMTILDIAMILSGMSLLGATLTLPGIAGIVLTIGMAVDA
ncbi:MAG: protein translocase subunit SecD, partial [Deltaproteobacteria bacterium]|nr:protein translocase subunit SecD [Deltaproteobacteria bacterium]